MVQTIKKPMTKDATFDVLFKMHTELLSELWIAIDRMTLLEKALEEDGTIAKQRIEKLVLTPELEAELAEKRSALVKRVIEKPWRDGFTVASILET